MCDQQPRAFAPGAVETWRDVKVDTWTWGKSVAVDDALDFRILVDLTGRGEKEGLKSGGDTGNYQKSTNSVDQLQGGIAASSLSLNG